MVGGSWWAAPVPSTDHRPPTTNQLAPPSDKIRFVLLFLVLALAQEAECGAEAKALLTDASARMAGLDAAGASDALSKASALGCADARIAMLYLGGLAAAKEAYALGGAPESLRGVNDAIAALAALSPRSVPAQIARYVLQAAAAAAQSERDEMRLFLEQALRIEALQLLARQPGAPIVTAHEVAGDLWLRVHRFDEARQAYVEAGRRLGPTPRTRLGMARAEARLRDGPGACPDTRPTCP